MQKFRKKPVVIEAVQWTGSTNSAIAIGVFMKKSAEIKDDAKLLIPTLEGTMEASEGDWIIKGVSGEFYPCKPDVFEKTYEPVD